MTVERVRAVTVEKRVRAVESDRHERVVMVGRWSLAISGVAVPMLPQFQVAAFETSSTMANKTSQICPISRRLALADRVQSKSSIGVSVGNSSQLGLSLVGTGIHLSLALA